jgi:hypothetical protein
MDFEEKMEQKRLEREREKAKEMKEGASEALQEEIDRVLETENGKLGTVYGLAVDKNGWTGKVFLDPEKRCETCAGSGFSEIYQFAGGEPCDACDNTGLVSPWKGRYLQLRECLGELDKLGERLKANTDLTDDQGLSDITETLKGLDL